MNLAVGLLTMFACSFVFAFVMRAAAISVYKTTGVDMLGTLHKVVWYVQIVGLILMAIFEVEYWLMILFVVALAAVHVVLGRKAGISIAVVLGVLEVIGGMMAAALNILIWILNLAMKISDMGSGSFPDMNGAFSINEEAVQARKARLEAAKEEEDESESEDE